MWRRTQKNNENPTRVLHVRLYAVKLIASFNLSNEQCKKNEFSSKCLASRIDRPMGNTCFCIRAEYVCDVDFGFSVSRAGECKNERTFFFSAISISYFLERDVICAVNLNIYYHAYTYEPMCCKTPPIFRPINFFAGRFLFSLAEMRKIAFVVRDGGWK